MCLLLKSERDFREVLNPGTVTGTGVCKVASEDKGDYLEEVKNMFSKERGTLQEGVKCYR